MKPTLTAGLKHTVPMLRGDAFASPHLPRTHANGSPLDLARLAEADDFNLLHDFCGIQRHIDRSTGQLTGHFVPRFSA